MLWKLSRRGSLRARALAEHTPGLDDGQYLIRAENRQEAEAIAARDPFTAAGFTTYEIIEWEVHQIMGIGPFTAEGLRLPQRG